VTGFRSGVVAVVGRPNVGKSTLVNTIVGRRIAIVSDKPQTTRAGIRGILTTADAQVVFTDTPGFHKPKTALGTRLNAMVSDAIDGVDVVLHVVDASSGVGRGDAYVYERQVKPARTGARFCVVNKADRLRRHDVVPQLAAAAEIGEYDEIVPVAAISGVGVGELLALVIERLPEGSLLYPDRELTDQSLELRVAELVREKALMVTREEVPHSIAVVIEEMEVGEGLTKVHAAIVVERDSQKGIVIGKGGETLKLIGTRARRDIEALLGTKVFLDLRVKVLKEWQRDPRALDRLGF
jgi:GTP-binding protein Era